MKTAEQVLKEMQEAEKRYQENIKKINRRYVLRLCLIWGVAMIPVYQVIYVLIRNWIAK